VDTLRTQIARDRLGENPLRRLGRRETGETWLTPQCRGIAGGNYRAFAGADHRRSKPPREVQQPHRVDLKIAVENLRIDLQERAERATDRVVDDDARITKIALDGRRRGLDLRGIRHVASISPSVRQLL